MSKEKPTKPVDLDALLKKFKSEGVDLNAPLGDFRNGINMGKKSQDITAEVKAFAPDSTVKPDWTRNAINVKGDDHKKFMEMKLSPAPTTPQVKKQVRFKEEGRGGH